MHIHVNARRWFHTGPGNTYHTVSVIVDDTHIGTSDMEYGYGEHFLHTAGVLLLEAEVMPADFDPYDMHALHTGRVQREHPTVTLTYDVVDVPRRKDLHDA